MPCLRKLIRKIQLSRSINMHKTLKKKVLLKIIAKSNNCTVKYYKRCTLKKPFDNKSETLLKDTHKNEKKDGFFS